MCGGENPTSLGSLAQYSIRIQKAANVHGMILHVFTTLEFHLSIREGWLAHTLLVTTLADFIPFSLSVVLPIGFLCTACPCSEVQDRCLVSLLGQIGKVVQCA